MVTDRFVRKSGQQNLQASFFYLVRFFGYSYIDNPWLRIPFESMQAFTYHLMWVEAFTYKPYIKITKLIVCKIKNTMKYEVIRLIK